MATVDLLTTSGTTSGSVELDDALFGVEPNGPVMHQVVVAQLAAARKGTASTKTRAEVRGGGRKPWRQKGTGNARQGSIRAPHWRGGGVAHGPKPRSYAQRTPKKMKRLALASALSDRLADQRLIVLDGWGLDTPSTKGAKAALAAVGAEGRVLVVLGPDDDVARRSLRNLPGVSLVGAGQVTTYDVLVSDYVIYTRDSLPGSASAEPEHSPTEAAQPSEDELS
ncbi:MAG: 50S ribosomal protein L4 [Microthrixaceae bacterium]